MDKKRDVSLQLYSVRDEIAKDYAGTVRKVAELGYTSVEFASYGGLSAKDMKKLLAECNLNPVGTHVGYETLDTKLKAEIEYCAEVGVKYIICPGYHADDRDGWLKFADKCARIGEQINKAGMRYGYHNHSHELKKYGDEYALDILFDNCPAEYMTAELDVYWIAHADIDAFEFIKKYGKRAELLHVKQMSDYTSKRCVVLDEGVIDYKAIVAAEPAGMRREYIVEQEEFDRPVYEAIAINSKYLANLLK